MDWRSTASPQIHQKRLDYVKGLAKQLDISEQEATILEQQAWNGAPTLNDYPKFLKVVRMIQL